MDNNRKQRQSFFARSFSLNNLKPKKVGQFPSIPLKDTHDTKIENFIITSKQNIVIADETNETLKMLNLRGDLIFEFPLRTKPTGICVWTPTILIISLPIASMLVVVRVSKRDILLEAGLKTKTGYELLAGSKDLTLVCSRGWTLDVYRVGPQYSLQFLHKINLPHSMSMIATPRIALTRDGMILVGNILGSHISTYNNLGELVTCEQIPLNCLLSDMAYYNNHLYLADYKEDRILQLTMDLKVVSVITLSANTEWMPTKISISSNGFLALLYKSFHATVKIYTL